MSFYSKDEIRGKLKHNISYDYGKIILWGPDVDQEFYDFSIYPKELLRKTRKIEIRYTNIKEIDTTPLEYCENLEEIEIIFTNIKRIELSPLENLPIKRINISGNLLENINLEPLSKMRELERIELSENNLREIDLKTTGRVEEN